jgi:hypothetical protein
MRVPDHPHYLSGDRKMVILEEETYKKFGYYPSELKPKSRKRILVKCDICKSTREIRKDAYHSLCISCARKGKRHSTQSRLKMSLSQIGHCHSEETKQKIREAQKGRHHSERAKQKIREARKGTHPSEETRKKMSEAHKGKHPTEETKRHMSSRHPTEETKALISAAMKGKRNPWFGKRGKDAANFKGGKKAGWARARAKRKRNLGYTLLALVKEGEVGHHVTDNEVLGIPAEVHLCFSGYTRKKHRTLVLQWLKANDKKKYKLVLCILAKQPLH